EGGDRLAAARLADDAEHLAPVDVQRHPLHRLHHAGPRGEVGVQVAHLEERGARGAHATCTGRVSVDGFAASWNTLLVAVTPFVARYGSSATPALGRKFGNELEAIASRIRWPALKRWATGVMAIGNVVTSPGVSSAVLSGPPRWRPRMPAWRTISE